MNKRKDYVMLHLTEPDPVVLEFRYRCKKLGLKPGVIMPYLLRAFLNNKDVYNSVIAEYKDKL